MIKLIELKNLGTINQNKVIILTEKGRFDLYFSYETIVGIEYWVNDNEWHKQRVIKNYWSTTTGKLLKKLEPDKDKRITKERFMNELGEMFMFMNQLSIESKGK